MTALELVNQFNDNLPEYYKGLKLGYFKFDCVEEVSIVFDGGSVTIWDNQNDSLINNKELKNTIIDLIPKLLETCKHL